MKVLLSVFCWYWAFCSMLCAQAQEINGWLISSPTSLVVSTVGGATTLTSSSSNTNPIAIAPKMVLLPCMIEVAGTPYLEAEVNFLTHLPISVDDDFNSRTIMGYQCRDTSYWFAIRNSRRRFSGATCPTPQDGSTRVYAYVNEDEQGQVSQPCATGNFGSEPDVLKLDIVPASGDLYDLRIFRNGTEMAKMKDLPLSDGYFFVSLRDSVGGGNGMSGGASLRAIMGNYPCTNTPFFNELQRNLDGGFVKLYDDTLRIKFVQEYAAVGGSESIPFNIYNWNRSTNTNSTFSAVYGVNWVKLPVGSYPAGVYHTIEVVGNKKEKYFLRFKR